MLESTCVGNVMMTGTYYYVWRRVGTGSEHHCCGLHGRNSCSTSKVGDLMFPRHKHLMFVGTTPT